MWFLKVHSFEFHRTVFGPPLSFFVIILMGSSSLECFALLSLVPSMNELGFASQVLTETWNRIQTSHLHFYQKCQVKCWVLMFKWFTKYWWMAVLFYDVFLQLLSMDALWDSSKNYTKQILLLTLLTDFTSKTVSLITTWLIMVAFFAGFLPFGIHRNDLCVSHVFSCIFFL